MEHQADIIVIGAGAAGLSFCKSLSDCNLKITIIDNNSKQTLADPKPDGRETAITHLSKEILMALGAWKNISIDNCFKLKQAQVKNGNSPFSLHFPTPQTARGKPADTLGYLIPHFAIRKALYQSCESQKNLNLLTEKRVKTVSTHDDFAQVELESGEILTSKLIIAADSRFSNSRRQMGISCQMNDFGRTVIVFRMKHSLSNQLTATECFYYGRTLAILPLNEYLSSVVLTIDSSKADDLFNQSPEQTRKDIMSLTEGKLGDMELVSQKHRYPLVGVHANQFYANRYALIGDASVGMHPVTAHGFNLGLEGQNILSKLIKEALDKQLAFDDQAILKKYHYQHKFHTLPLYLGTNTIVKLFTTETPPVKILRHAAIAAGNIFMPFKKLVSKQLTG